MPGSIVKRKPQSEVRELKDTTTLESKMAQQSEFLCKTVNWSYSSVQCFENCIGDSSILYTIGDPYVEIKSDPIYESMMRRFKKRFLMVL